MARKQVSDAAKAAPRPPVRVSVPVDVRTHARLCACAALRGVDRAALAAEILTDGLKDVVVVDSRRKSVRGTSDDRLDPDDTISSPDDNPDE